MMVLLWMVVAYADLTLADVLQSTEQHLPALQAAGFDVESAEAALLGSRGAFDPTLSGKFKGVTGEYERSVADVRLTNQTLWGPEISAGYTRGRGEYPTYDGSKTVDEGEFVAEIEAPVLAGAGFGKERAKLLDAQAKLEGMSATYDEVLRKSRLEASKRYFKWVAAALGVLIAREQLALAERRSVGLERQIELGQRADIDRLDNDRAMAERASDLAEALSKQVAAAQDLSLFLRDASGRPRVPDPNEVPADWPAVRGMANVPEEVVLDWRPDRRKLDAEATRAEVERRLASRAALPKLDLSGTAYIPLGADGKTELVGGISLEAPLAFRAARGARRGAEAGLRSVEQQRRGLDDQIRAEWVAARTIRILAEEQAVAARIAAARAREVLELEGRRFELGGSDLFKLLQREDVLVKDRKSLLDAEYNLRVAEAVLDAMIAPSSGAIP